MFRAKAASVAESVTDIKKLLLLFGGSCGAITTFKDLSMARQKKGFFNGKSRPVWEPPLENLIVLTPIRHLILALKDAGARGSV
jgi:hypothetical protein